MAYRGNVVLISTYELGRQPFGLASPAAWLRRAGARVTCLDLSREPLREEPVRQADLIAFYVPMHTATRLAVEVLPAVRKLNPRAQPPVPPLPDRARLRRPLPDRPARRGPRRHPPAGRGRR